MNDCANWIARARLVAMRARLTRSGATPTPDEVREMEALIACGYP